MKIAIWGGTGDLGKGLALRFAMEENEIIIGSRSLEKAEETAEVYSKLLRKRNIRSNIWGATNEEAPELAHLTIFAIPYENAFKTAENLRKSPKCYLKNKIIVSPVVPMKQDKEGKYFVYCPPKSGSAAEEIAAILNESWIISAFHIIPAKRLSDLDEKLQFDVLVCGDNIADKQMVMDLIGTIEGLRPLDAGPLICSRVVENVVPLLINLNIYNKGLGELGVKFV